MKNYLEKHRHQVDANIAAIEHSNSTYESGLPYDFIIHKNDGEKIYLEVKTTNFGFQGVLWYIDQPVSVLRKKRGQHIICIAFSVLETHKMFD